MTKWNQNTVFKLKPHYYTKTVKPMILGNNFTSFGHL